MNRLKNKIWIESGSPIRNELDINITIKFGKVRAIIIEHVNAIEINLWNEVWRISNPPLSLNLPISESMDKELDEIK